MGSGSKPGRSFREPFAAPVSLLPSFSLRVREAVPAPEDRFPSPWDRATSAHASRSARAAAEEAAAFATESSLASSDAALPIPLNEIVPPFAPLPFASGAPCPFGLFLEFIGQFTRCAAVAGGFVRSGKLCRNNPSSAPRSEFTCARQSGCPCARGRRHRTQAFR